MLQIAFFIDFFRRDHSSVPLFLHPQQGHLPWLYSNAQHSSERHKKQFGMESLQSDPPECGRHSSQPFHHPISRTNAQFPFYGHYGSQLQSERHRYKF